MRHIFIFLLIISVIAGCSKKPVDKAKQFIEAGMYGDAIPLLEEEIQKNPKNTEAHYLLGMAFLNLGEEDGASQSFDRAIKLDQKKYTKKTTEAYNKTGLNFLGQDTPAGVRRGLRYLDQALDTDASLKSEISKAYRDRGIALAKNDKSLSYTLLVRALELDPNLKRDNDFYYALYIEDVEDPELKNKGCEDFLSLFPESKHVEDVLYSMGNYQYYIADYQKAKQYFSQLGERYPDTELGKKAKVMVDNITKMEQEIGQAELERARKIKQMEIEKAERLKQMQIEAAEKQKQMEIERARLEKEAKIKESERQLQEAQARTIFEGTWILSYVYQGKNKVGKLNLDISGNILTGSLNTGFTLATIDAYCSVSGTVDGNSFSVKRTCDEWGGGQFQIWSGRVDPKNNRMQGTFTWKGNTYSFSGTKEK
ncbi:MAG: tetratricopeptide repeat protein [candidate division Zixibacteria bacterium]|nr:tetratricopeptide repeat protein [candidate division Zixibacteria bacterium]